MKKEEVVKKFFEHGFLLSPEMLEKINEKNIDEFLDKLKKSETKESVISEVLDGKKEVKNTEEIETKPNITIKEIKTKTKLSSDDFVKYYNNKYNGIKNVLLKKISKTNNSPVSINKVSTGSNILVIGMIRELTPAGFILEDTTGTIECMSKETVSIDDVIAVKGFAREKKLLVNEIIYPDVPLNNKVNKIKGIEIILTEKPVSEEMKSNFVFIFNLQNTGKSTDKLFFLKSNPSWFTISNGKNSVNILVYKPTEDIKISQVVDFLKKRHLSPGRKYIKNSEDYFLLDPIPDILWIITNEKNIQTYKGVTVISNGKTSYSKINLETREVEFKDL